MKTNIDKATSVQNPKDTIVVILAICLPSATLFAPIELPTRLQMPSWKPIGIMNDVAAMFRVIEFAASSVIPI